MQTEPPQRRGGGGGGGCGPTAPAKLSSLVSAVMVRPRPESVSETWHGGNDFLLSVLVVLCSLARCLSMPLGGKESLCTDPGWLLGPGGAAWLVGCSS